MEAELGFRTGRIRVRITLDLLKESIDCGKVKVEMGIETGAEPMQETHGPHRGRGRGRGAGFLQGGQQRPEENVQHGGGGLGSVVKVGPQTLGNREHELADGDVGEHMVHQVSSGLGHVAG